MKQQSQELLDCPESTDWLDPQEQQFWFDRFALDHRIEQNGQDSHSDQDNTPLGLRFQQFQEFLRLTLYCYFEKFPQRSNIENKSLLSGQHENYAREADELRGHMTRLYLNQQSDSDPNRQFTKQQEMLLFKRFDQKNDHVIDREEFALMCQKWLHQVFRPACALIVVDVQNDFIDGSLALINGPARQDGAEVVPVVNALVDTCQRCEATIVYTQDWHPQDHLSFHDNLYLRKHTPKKQANSPQNNNNELNDSQQEQQESKFMYKKFIPKAKLFDTVLFDEGRVEQKLWPTHCVSNTWGAQFHPKLKVIPEGVKIQKGTMSHVDAYSAFWDNMRSNETGLRQELVAKGVTDLFFCGLALDYCVAASALDAAKAGFITFVVEDACRGIDLAEIEKRKQELRNQGAFLVKSDQVETYLTRHKKIQDSMSGSLDRSLIKTVTYRRAFA